MRLSCEPTASSAKRPRAITPLYPLPKDVQTGRPDSTPVAPPSSPAPDTGSTTSARSIGPMRPAPTPGFGQFKPLRIPLPLPDGIDDSAINTARSSLISDPELAMAYEISHTPQLEACCRLWPLSPYGSTASDGGTAHVQGSCGRTDMNRSPRHWPDLASSNDVAWPEVAPEWPDMTESVHGTPAVGASEQSATAWPELTPSSTAGDTLRCIEQLWDGTPGSTAGDTPVLDQRDSQSLDV